MFSLSADLYDAIYSFRDYAGETAQVATRIRALHPAARTLLDVGCGTGEHVRRLATAHGFDADGLDLEPGLIEIARQKHPSGRFTVADMSDFTIDRSYDVVLSLFSSIGYLVTIERVRRAFASLRRHVGDEGLLLVEPWFPPGVLEDGREFQQTGTSGNLQVDRRSRCEIAGHVSRLHFDYEVSAPDGVQHFSEIHELGLFTEDEMRAAFTTEGWVAELDPNGLTGRGLWIARPRF